MSREEMEWQLLDDNWVPWHDMERDVVGRREMARNGRAWIAQTLKRTSASQKQVVNARLREHLAALAESVWACHLRRWES